MTTAPKLLERAKTVLRAAHLFDSERLRYSVGIDVLRELEEAVAEAEGREPRKDWTPK